jgi:hypothetical protein
MVAVCRAYDRTIVGLALTGRIVWRDVPKHAAYGAAGAAGLAAALAGGVGIMFLGVTVVLIVLKIIT